MAFPFSIRPSSPSPASKPAPGQVPNKPAPQKISALDYLFGKPLTSQGPAKKTTIKPKPGFLERGGFRKHDELMHEVRKYSYYKSIPNYGRKFTQTERINLIKDLEKASRGAAGLTQDKLSLAIKNLTKEKMIAQSHREFGKAKILDQKIKQAQAWKKTWDRPKL